MVRLTRVLTASLRTFRAVLDEGNSSFTIAQVPRRGLVYNDAPEVLSRLCHADRKQPVNIPIIFVFRQMRSRVGVQMRLFHVKPGCLRAREGPRQLNGPQGRTANDGKHACTNHGLWILPPECQHDIEYDGLHFVYLPGFA